MPDDAPQQRLFTIGHSNHPLDAFLALLQTHDLDLVVDVRSLPRSGYAPHFDREPLRKALEGAGIGYVWQGDELGGRPGDADLLDESGRADYQRMAASGRFAAGLARLRDRLSGHGVVLLCGEENPAECHRRLLVGRVLFEAGVDLTHIRGDGTLQTEEELRAEERTGAGGQQSLFDAQEVQEWKSTRSVSRRNPPKGSSGR